jgi:sulfatase modifying factor 1
MRALVLCIVALGCNGPPGTKVPAHPPLDAASVVRFSGDTFNEGFDGGVQGANGSSWWVNEKPSHDVTLAPFGIDTSEVSVTKYATFLRQAGGIRHHTARMPITVGPTTQGFTAVPGTESTAMRDVTWFDARAYCLWMGGDLPTEAQWEYAAKSTDVRRTYPWGTSSPTCTQANYFNGDVACAEGPGDAGALGAGDTPEGVHDMAGNVAEWTFDAYDAYPSDPKTDPRGADAPLYGADAATVLRTIRGGGYRDIALSLRITNRYGADAALRSKGVGFRCAYP